MTIHRTHWNSGELQALHAWIVTQGPQFLTKPLTTQVVLAQQAVLPVARQRSNVYMHSQADRAMTRIMAASQLPPLTPQQRVQVPAFTAPPLAPTPTATMSTVYLQHGTTVIIGMPPGKYMLEVM
jgi:hypothetical protein